MKAGWRTAAKGLLPESWRIAARTAFGWRWFDGDYANWAEARAASGGYDDAVIVERVLEATLAVRDGRAAFERDGVAFMEPVAEPGLVAALRRVAGSTGGRLRVVDFGGSLGSTYWRHRAELVGLHEWSWDIVEQASFVSVGRARLGDTPLRFFGTFKAAASEGPHDLLLASGVLQYLEAPEATLDAWAASGIPWLLLNNLPLHAGGPDRIAVQRVPPEIYPASYPARFFNREKFLARLRESHEIVMEFAAEAVWPVGWRRYPSTGLLLRRKDVR